MSTTNVASNAVPKFAPWVACALLTLLAWGSGIASAETTPVVKAYVCPAGTAQGTAEKLRTEFGVIPGVRIAADDRTSQVIVYAPAELQTFIARRLAVMATPAPANAPAGEAKPAISDAAGSTNRSRSVSLRHCAVEQLEAALVGLLGNRLTAVSSPQPQTRRFRVACGGGDNVELAIDLGGKQVAVEGPAAAVESCARLIQALDSAQETGGQSTRLVPLRTSKPASIRRAIDAIRDTAGAAVGRRQQGRGRKAARRVG